MDSDRRAPDGLRRLNARLDPEVSFIVLSGSERGVLVYRGGRGGPRLVSRALRAGRRGRLHGPNAEFFGLCSRLHAIAACFAECVMDLGLGSAVYARRRRSSSARAGESS